MSINVREAERLIISSDTHEFIGRVYDLAIPLHPGFGTYDQLQAYPDCLYVVQVESRLSLLVRRVESLNLVGDMLWPEHLPDSFTCFPASRYEWVNISADVFLMRFISVLDCTLLVTNEVFETGLAPRKCYIDRLKKGGVSPDVIATLEDMLAAQGDLRQEGHDRMHSGIEHGLTDDDTTFKIAALLEASGLVGNDRHGREIDLPRFFAEALGELRQKFLSFTADLTQRLDALYDALSAAFEPRFSSKFRARSKPLPW